LLTTAVPPTLVSSTADVTDNSEKTEHNGSIDYNAQLDFSSASLIDNVVLTISEGGQEIIREVRDVSSETGIAAFGGLIEGLDRGDYEISLYSNTENGERIFLDSKTVNLRNI